MRKTKRGRLYYLLGLAFSTLPAVISTLSYFPIWKARGGIYTVSGLALILLALAAIPSLRIIRERLKSPSAVFIWLAVFLLFFSLSRIAEQVTVIAFFGFLGNLCGSIFFRLSKGAVPASAEKASNAAVIDTANRKET